MTAQVSAYTVNYAVNNSFPKSWKQWQNSENRWYIRLSGTSDFALILAMQLCMYNVTIICNILYKHARRIFAGFWGPICLNSGVPCVVCLD